nr:MAG TPA: hypothetical protein [Microviridae sp.]
MEKKISPKSEGVYLVSVKSKTSNEQGKVFVVSSSSLDLFISTHLTSDSVLLIDTIDTYGIDV